MKNQGTISLCMIVKNEAANLDRCLKSLNVYVDEIIVVDTGSQDTTVNIAKSYGARVYKYPWQNDFSQARNESLRHATQEWILIVDADEELPEITAKKLKELALTPHVEAWIFTIVSPVSSSEEEPQLLNHPNIRMFKNKKDYYFTGKIHEQIKPSIIRAASDPIIKNSNLIIKHSGYMGDLSRRREKTWRNIAILKEALEINPASSFDYFNLAVSYYKLGDLENSQKYYQAALENLESDSDYVPVLYRNYCLCLYDLGEYYQALKLADRGLTYYADYPDLYYIKGQINWELGILSQVKANFLKCISFKTLPKYVTMQGVTTYLAFENLAEVYALEEKFQEAINYIKMIITEKPSYRLMLKLGLLLKKSQMDEQQIAEYLKSNLLLDDPTLIQILFDIKEYAGCLRIINNTDLVTPEMSWFKAKCLMYMRRYTEACESLPPVDIDSPLAEKFLLQRCIGLWLQNPRQDARATISAFKNPDSRVVKSCHFINCVIFAPGISNLSIRKPEEIQHILDIALEVLLHGDQDLATAIVLAANGNDQMGEANFTLGKLALVMEHYAVAKKLLERAVNRCKSNAEAYYLLGTACSKLRLNDKAFLYFHKAGQLIPENEQYKARALEELSKQCLLFITRGLQFENGNKDLLPELFRLASIKKRAQRFSREKQEEDYDTSDFKPLHNC